MSTDSSQQSRHLRGLYRHYIDNPIPLQYLKRTNKIRTLPVLTVTATDTRSGKSPSRRTGDRTIHPVQRQARVHHHHHLLSTRRREREFSNSS